MSLLTSSAASKGLYDGDNLFEVNQLNSVKVIEELRATLMRNKSEAQKILSEQLARFSGCSHSELTQFVGDEHVEAYEVRSAGGTAYRIEIQFFWDDRPGETIRVAGSIDDGGLRAFVPLTDSVLRASAGSAL